MKDLQRPFTISCRVRKWLLCTSALHRLNLNTSEHATREVLVQMMEGASRLIDEEENGDLFEEHCGQKCFLADKMQFLHAIKYV
jgi:hypothetical protein